MTYSRQRLAGCSFAILLVNGLVVGLGARHRTYDVVQAIAIASSLLVLLCAIVEGLRFFSARRETRDRVDVTGTVAWLRLTAILSAALAATILTVLLSIRLAFAALDTVTVLPSKGSPSFGFDTGGLWCLGLLFAGATLYQLVADSRPLATYLYLIAAAAGAWASLLLPVYLRTPNGSLEAGGATHAMQTSMAILLGVSGAVMHATERRLATGSDSLSIAPRSTPSAPGRRVVCGVQAVLVLILVCYHAAVPLPLAYGGIRASAVIGTVSALCGFCGCFLLARARWNRYFVDAALGLLSMALACAAMAVVPRWPPSMAERSPVAMTAQMIGLAVAVGLFTWQVELGQRRQNEGLTSLWVVRSMADAKRFAFLSGALAITLGGLMAMWPRLRFVAAPDDSIGRVTAGFGAYLFLFLTLLVCARRLRRLTFHLLTLMAMASAMSFMMIRMYPFTRLFE